MYMNVLHNELIFPEDNALDRDTRSFIRGVSHARLDFWDRLTLSLALQLLCKDPELRLKEPRMCTLKSRLFQVA